MRTPRTRTDELPASQRQLGDMEMRIKLQLGRELDRERRDRRIDLLQIRATMKWARRFALAALQVSAAGLGLVIAVLVVLVRGC